MRIYLVQNGDQLHGADGYSYGLLHGEHHRLLVSFVDYLTKGKPTIHDKEPTALDRRPISRRGLEHIKEQPCK